MSSVFLGTGTGTPPTTISKAGLLPDASLLKFWEVHHLQLAPLANPVFTKETNGVAFGSYAAALVSDKRRLPGLFVQVYG